MAAAAQAVARQGDSQELYECVHCSAQVPSLFVKYSDPGNTSLVQCSTCGQLADVHQSFPLEVLLPLDLVLLRSPVYRHLLRNRGGATAQERHKYQLAQSLKLGALVLAIDTLVRCFGTETASEYEFLILYAKTGAYGFVETLSFLLCPTPRPAHLLLLVPSRRPLSRHHVRHLARRVPPLALIDLVPDPAAFPRPDHDPPRRPVPLAPSRHFDAAAGHRALCGELQSGQPAQPARRRRQRERRGERGRLAQMGRGQSAVVAFSVLLRTSKVRSAVVLLVAWLLHLVVLHATDPFLS